MASDATRAIADALAQADIARMLGEGRTEREVCELVNAARDLTPDGRPYVPCHHCGMQIHPDDMGHMITDYCATCELNRCDQLVRRLVYAAGRRHVKRALKDLKALRRYAYAS